MNKIKLFLTIFLILFAISIVAFLIYKKYSPPKEIHYHAGFVVFDEGKKIDFSDGKYMYIKPCSVNENKKLTKEEEQMERAHLHDNVGDVVHVEAEDSKWGDLFANISYSIDYAKVTAFINGLQTDDIKNTPIKAYDSAVIFVGKVDRSLLSQAVTVELIKNTESKSETCGE